MTRKNGNGGGGGSARVSEARKLDKYTPMDKIGVDPDSVLSEDDLNQIRDILNGDDVEREDREIDEQIARNNELLAALDADKVNREPETRVGLLQRIGRWTGDVIRDNSWVLTIAVAVLLIGETAMLVEYPSYWWVVPSIVVGLTLLAIIWSNARVLIKAVVAIIVLAVETTLSFLSGTALTSTVDGGTMWAVLMITGWMVGLAVTYFIPIQHSRWTSVGFGSVIGFALSYALMTFGALACGLGAFASTIIATVLLAWDPVQALTLRRRGLKLETLTDEQANTLTKTMTGVNPAYKHAVLTWRKGEQHVYHGEGLPVYVFIPVEAKPRRNGGAKVKQSKKHGTIINGVLLDQWTQRAILHMHSKVKNPFPVVCLLDLSGDFTTDEEHPTIIDAPIVDSHASMHAGLISMHNGRRSLANRVKMLTTMFTGATNATARNEARLSKRLKTPAHK